MHLRLYYSEQFALEASKLGCDLNGITRQLASLEKSGVTSERVNTDALSAGDLSRAYIEAVMPAVLRKYRVRQVFGSRRNSGTLFGRHVPALVVIDEAGRPEDVYPHQAGLQRIEILDFLRSLPGSESKRPTTQRHSKIRGHK